MREDLLSIGKMARINSVTIPTLRLYDQLGLLKPRYIDEATGYRYYDIYQNARLDTIAYMKELGMRLDEIATVLEKEDISLIEEILGQKMDQLHEQMHELEARHNALERTIASIERYRKSPVTGTISLEYIDKRYVWGIPCCENFYEGDIRCFERALTELRSALIKEPIRYIHSYNIGTSIACDDFKEGQFLPKDVFIFLDKTATSLNETRVVDSGMFACIYLDNFDDEVSYAQKLLHYCKEKEYNMSGDYICEVMTEFNVFDSHQRSMFLRLQVPVSFR